MTGAELRDKGLEQAGSGFAVSVLVSWEGRAKLAVMALAAAEGNFSAEDVRRIAGDPPHPNCLGAVLRAAYREGLIRPAGVTVAARPSRHASLLRMWSGA